MHRDFEIAVLDVVLMSLGPPLLGAALALLIARNRCRPGRALVVGVGGATLGAWIGVAFYRLTILPIGRDLGIFEAIVLACVLLGAVPAAWLLAGPALPATKQQRPRHLGCAVALGGILLACLGFFPFHLGSERSAFIPVSEETKDAGIFVLLGGLGVVVLGLALLVWLRSPRPLHIVMFTRQGCHLCEDAWAMLEDTRRTYGLTLEAIDVDSVPELAAKFGDCVPVVLVDGKVRFRGQVNPVLLKRLLH